MAIQKRKFHLKQIFFALVGIFTIVFLSYYFFTSVRAQVSITVNVGNILQTETTNGARLGINTNYWWDEQSNRIAGARTLPVALSDMGAKYWRYPGGEKADGYLWSIPPYSAPNPKLARISSQDWPSNDPLYWTPAGNPSGNWAHTVQNFDSFMNDCQVANCTPVMVVAYDGIYKAANSGGTSLTRQQAIDTAAAWVNYANKVKGYNIKYWEIGNETWNPGYMGSDPGRTQQAQDFISFCQAMKNVDTTIWCGTTANSENDWGTLLANAASSIDFLSVHSYEAYKYGTYNDYINNTLYPNLKVDEAYNALQNYPSHKDRIKIAVTETGGITYGQNGTWTQADLGHALMTFDILAQLQQDRRVEFAQFWNTRFVNQNAQGNIWPYNQSEYDALKPDNSLSPQGLAMKILANYSLKNMVSTTSTPTVRSFASHDPTTGKVNIWLINKSTATTATTVALQNYTPTATASLSVLKGTGSGDMNPVFTQTGTTSISNNQLTLSLDPVSITVIQLSGVTAPTHTPTPTITPTASPTPTPAGDTTLPSVQVTSPTNGSYVTKNTIITIKASASDNVKVAKKVAKVEFWKDSTLLCRDTITPYTCAWRVPYTSGVKYYLSAVATDTANNAKKATITVTSR